MPGVNLFRAGAVVLLLFGLAHLMGHVSGKDAPPGNEQERQLHELMYGHKVNLMGTMRSRGEIVDGFSLAISVLTFCAGLTGLAVARSRDARLLQSVALVQCGMVAITLGISLRYWFAAPAAFLAIAMLCFVASALRLRAAIIPRGGQVL